MKRRFLAAALVAVAVSSMASAAHSAKPPALLTFSINLGPTWQGYSYTYRGLCISRADGTNARRLTGRHDDRNASWSPDGTQVAFSRYYDRSHYIGSHEVISDVFVKDTRWGMLLNISNGEGTFNDEPAWSPTGRYIAFSSGWTAFVVVVVDLHTYRTWEMGGVEAAWSPDGRLIAVTGAYTTGTDPVEQRVGIFVVRPDGSGRRLLIPEGRSPAWSPDGRRIAYSVGPRNGSWYEDSEIAVANADGSEPRLLTQTREPEASPAWSPDGKTIAFSRRVGRLGAIVVAKADGSGERVAVRWPGVNLLTPTWRPPRALPRQSTTRCPRR